jgi:acyl-CoA thioesterase
VEASEPEVRFDRDTRVTRLGPGSFRARIDPGWWIARGPNGGYVAAILLSALQQAVNDPERAPRSLTVHYAAPPSEGPVRIETRIERTGRSLTSISARMHQGDRVIALALAAFSKAREGKEWVRLSMPQVPAPEKCGVVERNVPIHNRYDQRIAIGDLPFSGGSTATTGGWIRLREPRTADALLVAAYTDSFPPALFPVMADREDTGGLPTVDLTIHFRSPLPLANAAIDDFALAVFRSRYAKQGFVEEDGEVWSRDGQLLAQSRQLAVML